MQEPKFSDEQLVAYCDDQCSDLERRQIEYAAVSDPELKRRIENIAAIGINDLKDAFHSELQQAPLKRLEEFLVNQAPTQYLPPKKTFGKLAIAAGLAATLFVGVVGGGMTTWKIQSGTEIENWRESVAVYQMLYSKDTLANIKVDKSSLGEMRERLRKQSGLNIEFFNLEKFGLTFKRGQILEFKGSRLVQLAYLSVTGQPVAICFLAKNQNEMPMKIEFRHGLNIVHWVKNGNPAMIIGDIPNQTLTKIVSKILEG